MNNKNKAFTLVELLAVIVILGIIIIIAVPSMINTTKDSKKKLFLESAKNIIRDTEHLFINDPSFYYDNTFPIKLEDLNNINIQEKDYDVTKSLIYVTYDKINYTIGLKLYGINTFKGLYICKETITDTITIEDITNNECQ